MIVLSVLIKLTKNIRKKIKMEAEKVKYYQDKIKKLKKIKSSEEAVKKLNYDAREFFKEVYQIPFNKTYIEITKIFNKKKMKKEEAFCTELNELIYLKKSFSYTKIKKLIDDFSEIVEKTSILNSK